MKVIFYGNRHGNLGDKVIRWWTSSWENKLNGKWKDSYSHVELLFDDTTMFSASQYENLTRFAMYNKSDAWTEMTLNISKARETLVYSHCRRLEGSEYDYLGVLGFVFGNRDSRDEWFCSEVVVDALQRIGCLKGVKASKVSPNALYSLLKGDNCEEQVL